MKIGLYKGNILILIADATFSTDLVFINEIYQVFKKEILPFNPNNYKTSLESWMFFRARSYYTGYESDDVFLKALGLENKKYKFGRMSEACVLYTILQNFKTKDDDYSIYPMQDEIVFMGHIYPEYGNIYDWKSKG